MSESFKNKNSENESSHEADFYEIHTEAYKFAKIVRQIDKYQKEPVPLGYPVVGGDGEISILETSWSSEPEKMPHSELELCSYVDKSGDTHSINLHAYGAYRTSPTMIAVETVTGADSEVRLGSEPAILVTDLDRGPDGYGAPLTDNELTKVVYGLFADDMDLPNRTKDMRNMLGVTIGYEDADTAQYEAFVEKMTSKFRERSADPGRVTVVPTSEEFWRRAGVNSTSDLALEREMQDEVYRNEEKRLNREWEQKGKLGRFAARVSKALYPNGSDDVRTY